MSFFFLNDNQNDKNYHADEEYDGDDDDGHNIKFKYRATKYLFPILLEAKCEFISNYKIGINFKLFYYFIYYYFFNPY